VHPWQVFILGRVCVHFLKIENNFLCIDCKSTQVIKLLSLYNTTCAW